jgi:DNA (cytosine-5)-methyltransferase 1
MASLRNFDFPVISMFSGAGGLDTGFVQAGFTPVLAIDANGAACQTYRTNHPTVQVIRTDLSHVNPQYVIDRLKELPEKVRPIGIIGGPPCEAFSNSNGHKRSDDPRAKLSEHYARLLTGLNRELDLDFFVFENVTGLKNQHAALFSSFKRLFTAAGFWIYEEELDARLFGVPQIRKRVLIVGLNAKKYQRIDFEFPTKNGSQLRTVRDAIEGLPAPVYFRPGLSADQIPFHPNHWCMTPRSPRFFNESLEEGEIVGRPFRVLNWDEPSWTVAYGHREVHVHPTGKRRLSVYEAMRLQGFPRHYQLEGTLSDQISLVSDAVPPPLARALAEKIRIVITDKSNRTRRVQDKTHEILWTSKEADIRPAGWRFFSSFFVKYARSHPRKLPWRKRNVTPFQLLVAELLLKQTKAGDVAQVWPILLNAYPTPRKLSKAPLKKLRALLYSLGFQRQRAFTLKRMAGSLQTHFNGEIPSRIDKLLELPGVGLYTAAAVACFAFHKRVPIVDVNVLRVLSRIAGTRGPRDIRRAKKIWALAWKILPREAIEQHNYGILDFASQICTRNPNCLNCPLLSRCHYGRRLYRSSSSHA